MDTVINAAPAITATDAIEMLRILGVTLTLKDGRLAASPANLIDDDVRWLIRKHRDAIIAELEDVPRWAWLVRFKGHTLETYHHPYATHADVIRMYPDALSVMPLPECLWPYDAAKESAA